MFEIVVLLLMSDPKDFFFPIHLFYSITSIGLVLKSQGSSYFLKIYWMKGKVTLLL